jgi:ADP-ribose pyrophosphatase YjhB (NUDIX family)
VQRQIIHPLSRDDFDAIYARVPRLTVEVLLELPDGLVLARRDIEPCVGQWHIPGGTVHFGESMVAAVRRVAAIELGIEVTPGELVGYIEYPQMRANGYPGWPVGMAFTATRVSGDLRGSDMGAEVACFRPEPASVPDDIIAEQGIFLRQWFARHD